MDWADRVAAFASRQDGLITAAQCADLGITRDQVKRLCRSGVWRPALRGVYQVWGFGRTHEIRAALLAAGPQAVAVSASAAQLFGLPIESECVHLAVPGRSAVPRTLHGGKVVVHQRELPRAALTHVNGARTTNPLWTVADLLLNHNRYTSVPAADAAIQAGLISEADLPGIERLLFRRRGAVHARAALEQVDGRAESPLESRGRLRCRDAGLAPDSLQAEICGRDGRLIGRVDMLWSARRLIAEAVPLARPAGIAGAISSGQREGAQFHDQPEALFRDRSRQNELISAGYAVIRFTWEDTLSAVRLPGMMRAAMR